MLDGLKIAGVLVEARFVSSRPDVFVMGVGLNVTGHPEGMGATSLGPGASRVDAARGLLEAADDWYARLIGNLADYRKAWRSRSFILGKRVRVKQDGRAFTGTVEDVDPIDGLVVRVDHSGQPRSVRGEHVEHLEVL
jgi:BirA family transcriptional regulator, biotin operon repressor / biotin---[acetyl-CoA-carboxylase] ligase